MLSRVILAIIVGVIAAIIVYVVGILLAPVTSIGTFLESVSYLIGVLAALWYFFAYGRTSRPLL